jgi:hypothetical protein
MYLLFIQRSPIETLKLWYFPIRTHYKTGLFILIAENVVGIWKSAIVFSIVLERKYELTVLNLNSKIMHKHIFPHFYSLETLVLWRPHRRKLALSRKHFRNAFLINEQAGYYTAGRGLCL